jgi:hypothetical protein
VVVAGWIEPADVVTHDDDDVGLLVLCDCWDAGKGQGEERADEFFSSHNFSGKV